MDTIAINDILKCFGITPKVRHCTGPHKLQYFINNPCFVTSFLYRESASLNEYWSVMLFIRYATGKHISGEMTRLSNITLEITIFETVPWPNIFAKTSLKMISWAIPWYNPPYRKNAKFRLFSMSRLFYGDFTNDKCAFPHAGIWISCRFGCFGRLCDKIRCTGLSSAGDKCRCQRHGSVKGVYNTENVGNGCNWCIFQNKARWFYTTRGYWLPSRWGVAFRLRSFEMINRWMTNFWPWRRGHRNSCDWGNMMLKLTLINNLSLTLDELIE